MKQNKEEVIVGAIFLIIAILSLILWQTI